jgi:hypothetical protein
MSSGRSVHPARCASSSAAHRYLGRSGTGSGPAALNAPEVTRAGSRRPGACLGTNLALRSTAGTTYSRAFMLPLPRPGSHGPPRASDPHHRINGPPHSPRRQHIRRASRPRPARAASRFQIPSERMRQHACGSRADSGPHRPHQAGLTCHNPNPPMPPAAPRPGPASAKALLPRTDPARYRITILSAPRMTVHADLPRAITADLVRQ